MVLTYKRGRKPREREISHLGVVIHGQVADFESKVSGCESLRGTFGNLVKQTFQVGAPIRRVLHPSSQALGGDPDSWYESELGISKT